MTHIAIAIIASVIFLAIGWVGGTWWNSRCEQLLNPNAGKWEGDN